VLSPLFSLLFPFTICCFHILFVGSFGSFLPLLLIYAPALSIWGYSPTLPLFPFCAGFLRLYFIRVQTPPPSGFFFFLVVIRLRPRFRMALLTGLRLFSVFPWTRSDQGRFFVLGASPVPQIPFLCAGFVSPLYYIWNR